MPVDQKRNNGPDTSLPYQLYTQTYAKTYQQRIDEVLTNGKKRKDGRKLGDFRNIFLKSGVLTQCKGSAYIEVGDTKIVVAVYDPREIPKQNQYSINGELFCDFKFSPFALSKRKSPQTDPEEKSLAQAMTRALEPAVCRHEFPNFQVDIFANVMQDGGSVLSAAITCAGLALADAGIPMFDIVAASSVGIVGDRFFVDPSKEEEEMCLLGNGIDEHSVIVMARISTHEQVSELYQSGGQLSFATIQAATPMLIDSIKSYSLLIKQLLVKKVTKCVEIEENKVKN